MALLEFYCEACQTKFEQLTSDSDPDRGKCPKCQGKNTRKLVSSFRVAGRGDLRESTFYHGCHTSHVRPREGGGSDNSGDDH